MSDVTDVVPKKKKKINSREKGKRGERAWRDFLREHGCVKAYRSQQFSGTQGDDDVTVPETPNIFHEVKIGNQVPQKIYDWMDKAIHDSKAVSKIPLVAMRRDYCNWVVMMDGNDYMNLLKDSGSIIVVFCPVCKSTDVTKNGITPKGKQKYLCNNTACQRATFDDVI